MGLADSFYSDFVMLRLKPSLEPCTIRGAKPGAGEVAERLNALVLKTSKG